MWSTAVFQMDTKRNSSEDWQQKVGREARELIDTWKPDLVYTTDDNAQKYVARHYLEGEIPFVFSGVNGDPKDYGLVGTRNHTGVLEQEHFVETVRLLKDMLPKVARIAVIVDDDPTWTGVIRRMKEKAATQLPDCQFVSWDVIRTFEEYQEQGHWTARTRSTPWHSWESTVLRTIRVPTCPGRMCLRWTTENSRIPDFTFWKDRIQYGTLCAVYVSGYEQGRTAGRLARQILVEGKSPASLPMVPTVKGEPIISLARAKKLGIPVSSELLLTATIISNFQWE